jgi:hypothetical protein
MLNHDRKHRRHVSYWDHLVVKHSSSNIYSKTTREHIFKMDFMNFAADPTQIQSRTKRVYLEGTVCLNRVYEFEVNLCPIIYHHRVCSPRHTFVVVFVLVLHLHSLHAAAAVFYFYHYHPFPYPLVAVHFRAG